MIKDYKYIYLIKYLYIMSDQLKLIPKIKTYEAKTIYSSSFSSWHND